MISKNKIKVLIVDDSALLRQTLSAIISSEAELEVIGTASDPYIAVSKMKSEKPDVITLDIQMPRMDGLTFLKKIMTQHPIPVVIISSITQKDSNIALSAFKYGAIDVIDKPELNSELLLKEWKIKLIDAITTAARSDITKYKITQKIEIKSKSEDDRPVITNKKICNSFILIGSSAGGTEVIFKIISQLDKNTLPILIVQHMPSIFTLSYANRLNDYSELTVREATSGDELHRGLALVAPGNMHMELKNNGFNYYVETNTNAKVNRHRPSVDVLFNSSLKFKGSNIMAIILSGMGTDGSVEMLKLKNAGATTIAQSRESSIVYGMPKEATRIGAADYSLSIDEITKMINKFSKNQ